MCALDAHTETHRIFVHLLATRSCLTDRPADPCCRHPVFPSEPSFQSPMYLDTRVQAPSVTRRQEGYARQEECACPCRLGRLHRIVRAM